MCTFTVLLDEECVCRHQQSYSTPELLYCFPVYMYRSLFCVQSLAFPRTRQRRKYEWIWGLLHVSTGYMTKLRLLWNVETVARWI